MYILIYLQSPELMASEEITAFPSVWDVSQGLLPREAGDVLFAAQSRQDSWDELICHEYSFITKLPESLCALPPPHEPPRGVR